MAPEPAFFEDEQIFAGKKQYTSALQAQVNDYAAKLRLAQTLIALASIRQDVLRSLVISNPTALEELRGVANACAKELGHKHGEWWV